MAWNEGYENTTSQRERAAGSRSMMPSISSIVFLNIMRLPPILRPRAQTGHEVLFGPLRRCYIFYPSNLVKYPGEGKAARWGNSPPELLVNCGNWLLVRI